MSTITTIAASDLITNSRAVINTNFSNLNTDKIETSYLDTDTTLAANSDVKIATQKAVKAYVDAGGNVNASTTNKGIVEEATDAEIVAGTDTGGTSARLYVIPSRMNTQIDTKITAAATSKKLYISTTEVTFTNGNGGAGAGTEQTLFSTTVTGGLLSTNNAIRFKMYVRDANIDAGASAWVFRVKYGASTQLTATLPTPSGNQTSLFGTIEGHIIADGSASVQKMMIFGELFSNNAETLADTAVQQTKNVINSNGSGAIDSSTNQTLAITLQQTNSANNDCVVEWCVIELIK